MKRRKPLKRSGRLRPTSRARDRELGEYTKRREPFLAAHPLCQVWMARHGMTAEDVETALAVFRVNGFAYHGGRLIPRSVDVHHVHGRTGGNFLNVATWLAVCRHSHEWIHAHPAEARARGWYH